MIVTQKEFATNCRVTTFAGLLFLIRERVSKIADTVIVAQMCFLQSFFVHVMKTKELKAIPVISTHLLWVVPVMVFIWSERSGRSRPPLQKCRKTAPPKKCREDTPPKNATKQLALKNAAKKTASKYAVNAALLKNAVKQLCRRCHFMSK